MSILNLPLYPATDQVAESGGVYYKWTGSKWKRLDTEIYRSFVENTAYKSYSGNTVTLDTERYNFHDITANESLTISIPPSTQYDKFYVGIDFRSAIAANTTVADISSASLVYAKSFTLTNGAPSGINFSPDGKNLYLLDIGNTTGAVYQYKLYTPWVVNSASSAIASLTINAQDTGPTNITFKPDGTRMYMTGNTNDRVYQYNLTVPWDLSTASYSSVYYAVGTQMAVPNDVYFKPDGTKMYVPNYSTAVVYQYTLSTPWNLSTASYDSVSFSVSGQGASPTSIEFSRNGAKMYVVNQTNDSVHQYTLSTPWNVGTASYDSISKSVIDGTPTSIYLKPSGSYLYAIGTTNDILYQFALSTVWSSLSITWPDTVKWADGTPLQIEEGVETYVVELTAVADNTFIGRVVHKTYTIGDY